MTQNLESPQSIRIFLASPSDVEQERDALSALFQESLLKSINGALALAKRNPHDPPRLNVLEAALKELDAKHAPGK